METKAVSYLRWSGDSQGKGDTIARQREAVEKYAAANQIAIAQEFRDEGLTGKTELSNRAGLSACMRFLQENGIDLVLVESSDRLARDLIVAEVIVREFQKISVRVVSASGGVDLTAGTDLNPTAKLVRQILAAVAEFDRCVITLKLRGAKDRKRAADPAWREGKEPFGMKEGETETLEIMRKMRAEGSKYQQIADALNDAQRPTRLGKPWTVGAVHKIITRAAQCPLTSS